MRKRGEDLTNREFGWLKVLGSEKDSRNHTVWKCQCRCGNIKFVEGKNLRSGAVKSCGCMRKVTGKKIKDSLDAYCVEGTYVPGILETRKLNRNNTSGIKGVSYRKDRGKWRAYIKIKRKNIFLGNFDTKEEAIAARKAAEEKWFGPYRESN